MSIIDESYLRVNSIDAVHGLASRKGNQKEAEELDRARMMILKMIDYIQKLESEESDGSSST